MVAKDGERDLPAAQLKLFDDVADLLESVDICMLSTDRVSNHQKSGSLKEQHLISVEDPSEVAEARLKLLDIGNEEVDYVGPRLDMDNSDNSTQQAPAGLYTLYNVSSQMDVLKQVHSRGRDLFCSSPSLFS